jgi:thiamine biosynthesis protein ThiI
MTTVIVRYHEIALKGGNRPFFESRLRRQLKWRLSHLDGFEIRQYRDRFELQFADEVPLLQIEDLLKQVSGVELFAFMQQVDFDSPGFGEENQQAVLKLAQQQVLDYAERHGLKAPIRFALRLRRKDKHNISVTSMEMSRDIAAQLLPMLPDVVVDLSNPEVELHVDWCPSYAQIYVNKIPGPGGLPIGTGGKVVQLMSSGFDSPVAAWKMMNRGAKVVFVHFHSYPAVGRESLDNVEGLVKQLANYQGKSWLYFIPLLPFQKEVVLKAPAEYRTLLYRRMMMRLAQAVLRKEEAKALVTGESLGQVASQTLDNLAVVDAVSEYPVLRPLIGSNKHHIIDLSRKIGTEHISKQPYEDCCSLFADKSPVLSAKLDDVLEIESRLNVDEWMERLWAERDMKKITL